MNSDLTYYGMGMQSQALSHIALIRAIACCVTFEMVKLERQNCVEKLEDYRIPIELPKLLQFFYSLNTCACRAIKMLQNYCARSSGKFLFQLNGGIVHFQEFAISINK